MFNYMYTLVNVKAPEVEIPHLVVDTPWGPGVSSVILLPSLGYSLCLSNLGINPNEILRLGKKSPKLGNYCPPLDWEAVCIWL